MSPPDSVAIEAARLLGADRPWRRASDAELVYEGQYHAREARLALALDPPAPGLVGYHAGALEGIGVEVKRRLGLPRPRVRIRREWRDAIEGIKTAVPCQEFMQPSTDMKPAGRERWLGLCPFHIERTPSLSVWPTHFVCFGCGAKGDVFELARVPILGLRGHEATFRDAVRVLADYAGLPDPDRAAAAAQADWE